jgi:hypothetical protein
MITGAIVDVGASCRVVAEPEGFKHRTVRTWPLNVTGAIELSFVGKKSMLAVCALLLAIRQMRLCGKHFNLVNLGIFGEQLLGLCE